MLGVNVFAADSDGEARRLLTSLQQAFVALRRGTPGPLKPPVDSMSGLWSDLERAQLVDPLEQRAASKPNDSSALMDLGRAYQRRKDWSKAEAAFRSALEASHANREAAIGLSDVLYQEQRYEESAAALNLAKSQ